MATLGALRNTLLVYLTTTADDPLYTPAVLNGLLTQAHRSLLEAVQHVNRSYLIKEVLLTPDAQTQPVWASAPLNQYTFASQSPAIADFSYWVELRKTNEDGDLLKECRFEELRDAGNGFFCFTGVDESVVLRVSRDTENGLNLFLRYGYQPVNMVADTDVPGGIPAKFHDVIALEACFGFGLGGESVFPADLKIRWLDRKAELLASVTQRGMQPQRIRVDPFDIDWMN
ncbi:MAG TPA: hypothetical protein VJS20_04570 [Gemmatimonadales bacterium]|nr:hypothetical protein [Gemmatimonadales bacterium]